jgi:hypothetical protein
MPFRESSYANDMAETRLFRVFIERKVQFVQRGIDLRSERVRRRNSTKLSLCHRRSQSTVQLGYI